MDSPPATPRAKRVRWLLSVSGPLVVIGVLGYIFVQHGHDVGKVVNRVSAATLGLVTALALITLLARTESATECMTAMNRRPSRVDIYAASSVAFLISTVNHYIGAIARAAILQRLDRERSPTIPQMVLVDGSTYLIEGMLAALLLIVSAGALDLAWWVPVLAAIAAAGTFAAALYVRRRFRHHRVFDSLEMLGNSRSLAVVVALTVVIFGCQIGRTMIALTAVGLHPSLLQGVATFLAGGVLSNLLAGPGAGTAGAPLIVFGAQSLAGAAAAGLILAVSALLAAMVYALVGGPVIVWRLRRPKRALELPAI